MNNLQLLLNKRFTASTQNITSNLEVINNYYAYINSNGGGIVNPYNVRGYLNDPNNQTITIDFFAYLTGSTTQEQALNILSSDKKLSEVFNSYYQNFIVSANTISSTSIIQQNLTGTNQIISHAYNHPWFGYANQKQLTGITQEIYGSINQDIQTPFIEDFTTEESYYVSVQIDRGTNQIPRSIIEPCDVLINSSTANLYPQYSAITSQYFSGSTSGDSKINTLLQCFVDLNLETNSEAATPEPLLMPSFELSSYFPLEGDTIQVKISLNQPSILGIEEVDINLIQLPGGAVLGADFTSPSSFPLTLNWAVGEQDKFITFNLSNDYEEELLEWFRLEIANLINLDPSNNLSTTIYIRDNTRLNYISLTRPPYTPDNSGVTHLTTDENNDIDFIVSLDHPAFGVESVTLETVPFLNTINGQVGPTPNPLLQSNYVLTETISGQPPTIINLPYTINFGVGETSRAFLLFVKDNSIIEPDKTAYFQLSSAVNSKIDQSQKMIEIKALDDDGKYKFVHLNLGTIYNEFGNSITNTLMRQINPQSSFGGGYQNMYVSQYANYLIEYGSTINFLDYSSSNSQQIKFITPHVKVRITNNGSSQSQVNYSLLNPGASMTFVIPSNDYIITASTNSNRNNITQFLEDANYTIEIIDSYTATLQSLLAIPNFNPFSLRALDNTTQETTNTLLLGNFSLPGFLVNSNDTSKAYRLKSHYKDINTGRLNSTDIFGAPTVSCPIVGTSSNNVSYSDFYANKLENISIFGIILLNYNQNVTYSNTNNFQSKYNGFEFIDYSGSTINTCNKTASIYNGLNYYNLPFTVEP